MDRITDSLLAKFSEEHSLTALDRDKRFEHFAAYITVKRQHNATFNTYDLVVGDGGDTSIDAIAIIVNGQLLTDVGDFEDLASKAGYLDVNFVFVQAETSSGFDSCVFRRF
jgi:hypothetical protein